MCIRLASDTEMNRLENTLKHGKEDDHDARGNCTKQSKILGMSTKESKKILLGISYT